MEEYSEIEPRLFQDVTLDDLAEKDRMIAEAVGMDGLRNLVKNFAGSPIYIPKKYQLLHNLRVQKVREEFDGTNIRQLALKYNYSTSYIYKIVGDKIKQGIKHDIKGQTDFFDLIEQQTRK
ncbi:MAG: DNA-binding protein [Lachnospiraceae bacterium]|nr:DNA-binding protein [Lachnospiraceae bacterium]